MSFRLGASSHSSAGIPRTLDDRIQVVSYAAMAYWYYRWDWGEAIALDGIDFAGSHIEVASGWVDREIDKWVDKVVEHGAPVSPMGPIWALVRRLVRPSWERADAAGDLVHAFIDAVLSAAATSGAFTPERDGSHVYVDSLYGLPVALAKYALLTGDSDLLSQVISLTERHLDLLQDSETGLLAHFSSVDGTGPRIWWGRGNGWGVLGLVDLLGVIGTDRSPRLTEGLIRLVSSLIRHQGSSGEWRNLIAEEHSYPEASTTAMITAALAGAANFMGETDSTAWVRSWESVAHRIDSNGHVIGVSYRPGVNTDPARYEHTPVVGSYPWGQGAWLRAASAVS